ncbi:MAG TPA: divalent metal cation transporter [Candidatus Eisenbacteria bacterium]|nr:divalent metal cation transporter [Candidatus Eisenbacteria bacterium]
MLKKIKSLLKTLGPGFITGASDDDPSGIATYAQTGAQFGYSQLWTALFSFPFMTVIQEMCGRIGLVTGDGLAGVIRKNYAKPILFGAVFVLLIANTINVGADLGAMASSAQLILGIPFFIWLFAIAIGSIILQILVPYPTYAKFLKYLTLALFAYIITAFIIHQDWTKIALATFLPSFSFKKEYLMNIVAILGTTISPYLFFWEADEEVEEEIEEGKMQAIGRGRPRIRGVDIREMRLDTIIGMFFSQLVMFFIIVTTASTLFPHGITNIQTADQAAVALRPLAGNFAYLLFAAGIIGTGLLAVPILAGSAAYALAESFKWKAGLSKKFHQAKAFYITIAVITLVGLVVNFLPIKPFTLLYYTAVLNGICSPILMILILLVGNNKNIMANHTNSRFSNVMGWIIVVVMGVSALALLWSFIK